MSDSFQMSHLEHSNKHREITPLVLMVAIGPSYMVHIWDFMTNIFSRIGTREEVVS